MIDFHIFINHSYHRRPREAISWGKINERASFVSVEEDATVALPIIVSALKERIK